MRVKCVRFTISIAGTTNYDSRLIRQGTLIIVYRSSRVTLNCQSFEGSLTLTTFSSSSATSLTQYTYFTHHFRNL